MGNILDKKLYLPNRVVVTWPLTTTKSMPTLDNVKFETSPILPVGGVLYELKLKEGDIRTPFANGIHVVQIPFQRGAYSGSITFEPAPVYGKLYGDESRPYLTTETLPDNPLVARKTYFIPHYSIEELIECRVIADAPFSPRPNHQFLPGDLLKLQHPSLARDRSVTLLIKT